MKIASINQYKSTAWKHFGRDKKKYLHKTEGIANIPRNKQLNHKIKNIIAW